MSAHPSPATSRETNTGPGVAFTSAVLAVQVPEKVLSRPDARAALRLVMRTWLPLSEAVLGMVATTLPDPRTAVPDRLERLLPLRALHSKRDELPPEALQVVTEPCLRCTRPVHVFASVC